MQVPVHIPKGNITEYWVKDNCKNLIHKKENGYINWGGVYNVDSTIGDYNC